MKKVYEYLPLHFTVGVILGILSQFYTQFWAFGFSKLLILFLLSLLFLGVVRSKIGRTFLAFFLFFIIGVSSVCLNNSKNFKNYYQYSIRSSNTAILKIKKVLKANSYYNKYEVAVIQVDNVKTRGNVLLSVPKNEGIQPLRVDELIYTKPHFSSIQKPLNPYQFDYKFYLKKQGIHQQLFLHKGEYKNLGVYRVSLMGMASNFRRNVLQSLQKYSFKPNELSVINALLLGQRQNMAKTLIADYSKAGAIHILAVSGLHVGVLLWILTWLLKPLERLKNGKLVKLFFTVILLWMFAFIAGLSASVVRAVTMFTFLAVGFSLQRKNVVLFSLITSMLFLLIFKPMFLFDVGFQLSYLAVFGIVFIQSKLYSIYKPYFLLDKKIWEITTVSIGAQIGVLPLSLYYFHQFPGLFMLSNLIIIPFLGFILGFGIVIIILAITGYLPQFLASIFGGVISILNNFVSWISRQEQFLFQDISYSVLFLWIGYLCIVLGFRFLVKRSFVRLVSFLIVCIVLQSVFMVEQFQKKNTNEFVVFHKSKNSIFGERSGEQLVIHHDVDSLNPLHLNALKPYKMVEQVRVKESEKSSNIFTCEQQQILVVDSLGVYQVKGLQNPIVILQQSPQINLERLINTLTPKQIIADGSNYKSYIKRWQKKAKKEKTPFHYTGEDGAFRFSY